VRDPEVGIGLGQQPRWIAVCAKSLEILCGSSIAGLGREQQLAVRNCKPREAATLIPMWVSFVNHVCCIWTAPS
jgi:hypothetical protein